MEKKLQQEIKTICHSAKQAAYELAHLSSEEKQQALLAMAEAILARRDDILSANENDVHQAKDKQFTDAFIDRLTLGEADLESMVNGIRNIAKLPEPVGKILRAWEVESGLQISRVSVPLGVVGVIYESRPNVTADAAALCFKSGNAVILRGGSECAHTNKIITTCLQDGLRQIGINTAAVQYVPTQERAAIDILLSMHEDVDVIIPRGGKKLIQHVLEVSKIPVFKHLDGICHTYVHNSAELDMACKVILNAKMRRTGICGATETILIDQSVAKDYLPRIIETLIDNQCEVRGDAQVLAIDKRVQAAIESDWETEYLDAIVAIKVVPNIKAAIAHINHYGSHHTDAIISADENVATTFLQYIDSAIVMHNCSTQFADGGEFGMGAEIGIATGKLHARGPVGIEQLTTFKYMVEGTGQTRAR